MQHESKYNMVFENHTKSLIQQLSLLASFENRSILVGQKLMENAKIEEF